MFIDFRDGRGRRGKVICIIIGWVIVHLTVWKRQIVENVGVNSVQNERQRCQ